jgi:hypothetical protein
MKKAPLSKRKMENMAILKSTPANAGQIARTGKKPTRDFFYPFGNKKNLTWNETHFTRDKIHLTRDEIHLTRDSSKKTREIVFISRGMGFIPREMKSIPREIKNLSRETKKISRGIFSPSGQKTTSSNI